MIRKLSRLARRGIKIYVKAGNGGDGSPSFRREKFIEYGGPDGGDGGRGGHIIIRANHQMWTLYKYKFKKHFSAGNGEHGSKNRKSGSKVGQRDPKV